MSSHLLQLLSSCLTILVWYSCCIVACYRGVVRAYPPVLVPYTIRLHPVNLLQHWGLTAAHLLGGYNCPTVLIRSVVENSFYAIWPTYRKNRLCLLCLVIYSQYKQFLMRNSNSFVNCLQRFVNLMRRRDTKDLFQ